MSVIDLATERAKRGEYTDAVLDAIYDKDAPAEDRLAAMRVWYGWTADGVDFPEDTATIMEPIIARRKRRLSPV